MTIRLTVAQVSALRRIQQFGQGQPLRTYMPTTAEMRTFRVLERDGYCVYRKVGQIGVEYNGYTLSDKGHRFLSDSAVPPDPAISP